MSRPTTQTERMSALLNINNKMDSSGAGVRKVLPKLAGVVQRSLQMQFQEPMGFVLAVIGSDGQIEYISSGEPEATRRVIRALVKTWDARGQ